MGKVRKFLVGQESKQANATPTDQMISEEEVVDNELDEVKWASLEKKKAEKKSSVKEVSTVSPTKSLSVTFKLSWEVVAMELMKVYELVMEELSTEAGVYRKQLRCTGIYGHAEVGKKRHMWTLLKRLAELFTTSRPTSDYISAALGDSAQTVTKEMNQQLDNPFLAKEIYTTMSQMSLIKVLGPDKLHVAFS
ncbi:hypothetical protein WN944_013793 [Citrus x changshan-huyou]|uniref:Uncharacterized protein n=1 Tax=Citrus x changshan-huyou TaxID=2935761 RepID=A0AAP0QPE7_9ROSI